MGADTGAAGGVLRNVPISAPVKMGTGSRRLGLVGSVTCWEDHSGGADELSALKP